ncbi:hypothetical protein G6F40_016602 [Rhizopus arrhizus]|nr:hypothetical protein G6F40_016602 [Rhizopus arrhizus]
MLSDTPGTPGRRCVHLGDDPRRTARGGDAGFALDAAEDAGVQGEGRLQQALELHLRRQAGQLLEQQVHIVADVRIGGDQADVGRRSLRPSRRTISSILAWVL